MIPCQRQLFDIPDEIAYLNCAYLSPLLNSASAAAQKAALRKAHPWHVRPEHFFDTPEEARGLFARLIGADAEEIAIVPSASYGIAVAAANLPVAKGEKIVVLEEQFRSNYYSWHALAQARGGEMVAVPRPGNTGWTERILDHMDDRTAIVATPHCHWTDGSLIDVAQVAERAREVGAGFVLDLTQSIGALPFDAHEVKPDFMVAACYKWMLGPYSLGFLYADPKHHDGQPLEHNWKNRAFSDDFSRTDYAEDFQPGARRFDMGEAAQFANMPVAVAALEQLLAWGVDEIQQTLSVFTATIAERAAPLGLTSDDASLRAGHYLGLRLPGGVPDELLERLAQEQVYVSVRGTSIRVTPHLYNNDADVDKLLDVLRRSL